VVPAWFFASPRVLAAQVHQEDRQDQVSQVPKAVQVVEVPGTHDRLVQQTGPVHSREGVETCQVLVVPGNFQGPEEEEHQVHQVEARIHLRPVEEVVPIVVGAVEAVAGVGSPYLPCHE